VNKYHAQGKMKQGLGTVGKAKITRPGATTPADATLPMGDANWPGVPGKTQGKSRSNSTPTTGARGPFQVKKVGL